MNFQKLETLSSISLNSVITSQNPLCSQLKLQVKSLLLVSKIEYVIMLAFISVSRVSIKVEIVSDSAESVGFPSVNKTIYVLHLMKLFYSFEFLKISYAFPKASVKLDFP